MSRERQLLYWTAALVVFVVAFVVLRQVLLPFVMGMAIAYFLDPVADRLEKWGLSRTLSATALTIVFLIAVAAFLMVLVPILQSQVLDFASRLPHYMDLLRGRAEDLLALVQARLSPEDAKRDPALRIEALRQARQQLRDHPAVSSTHEHHEARLQQLIGTGVESLLVGDEALLASGNLPGTPLTDSGTSRRSKPLPSVPTKMSRPKSRANTGTGR